MSFEEAIYFHLSTIAIRLKVFKKIFPPAILQTPLTKLLSYLESSYMYQQKRLLFLDLCPGREIRDGTSGKWPGNPVPSRHPLSRENRDIRVRNLGLKYFLYLHV